MLTKKHKKAVQRYFKDRSGNKWTDDEIRSVANEAFRPDEDASQRITGRESGTYKEVSDLFFANETFIKDHETFWGLVGELWPDLGTNDKRWRRAFERYGRINLDWRRRWSSISGGSTEKIKKGLIDILKWYSLDDEITVYRGFHLPQGKAVRKGVKSIDNKDRHIQVEGNGFSYSLSEICCGYFVHTPASGFFALRYGFVKTEEEWRKFSDRVCRAGQSVDKRFDHFYGISGYKAVGKYRVKKRDIIGLFLGRLEQEVICFDHKVRLDSYEIFDFKKGVAAYLLHASLEKWVKDKNKIAKSDINRRLIGLHVPERTLINLARRYVDKVIVSDEDRREFLEECFKQTPTSLGRYLTGHTNDLLGLIQKEFKLVTKGYISLGIKKR